MRMLLTLLLVLGCTSAPTSQGFGEGDTGPFPAIDPALITPRPTPDWSSDSPAPSALPDAPATAPTPTSSPTGGATPTAPTRRPTSPLPSRGCHAEGAIKLARVALSTSAPACDASPPPPLTPRPERTFTSATFIIERISDDVYWAANGAALYIRDADPLGKAACYGECALRWPPVTLVPGETAILRPSELATLGEYVRRDGSRQLTFDGQPLYYYSGDTEPGIADGMCEEGWSMITPFLVEPLCP